MNAIPHPREWPVYDTEATSAAAELIARGRTFDYDHGEEIASFEEQFARVHGRRYALAVTSGTAALLAAYFALGLGPGDEVLISDYTFFSCATPLFLLGAVPVLCDAADETGNIDAAVIEPRLTSRTAAICVTHLWGNPCAMDAIVELASARGLALIEDCSHAHGATYRGARVGTFGDAAIFSLGGRKLISGGMGGVLLTDDAEIYARACLLTCFRHRTDLTIDAPGFDPFLVTGLGGNFRMTPVAAVLAKSHLDQLESLVTYRQENLEALVGAIAALPGVDRVPIASDCSSGAAYDAVVSVGDDAPLTRDALATTLQARGLKVREPSTKPLHQYPLFRGAAPDWSPLIARAVAAAEQMNSAESFPRASELLARWLRLPVNFLWEDQSSIVAPYAQAFADVLGTPSEATAVEATLA